MTAEIQKIREEKVGVGKPGFLLRLTNFGAF
jgi:hypothetical protein